MSYRQDPRDQYYNNNGFGNQYQGYTDGYQQGQLPSNPRMQNDGYRPPLRNPYSSPNPNIKGPSQGRTPDDDDSESVVSSIYSQPSVAGFTPSNNMRYHQEQPLETTEPRRQSLLYNEYEYPYPPSPFAASTNTHNSATGLTTGSSQQGVPLIDQNENNYMSDNMGDNYYQDYSQNNYQDTQQEYDAQNNYQDYSQNTQPQYDAHNNYPQDYSQNTQPQYDTHNNYPQDYSQNTQPQYDVYNDFNNNFQNDEKYNDTDSRNNTLTGPDGSHDPNPYALNVDSGNGKGTRQSTSGDHYVVTPKKERRCAFCSRKTCVIITFTILVLLAAGMYFVWPRIPVVTFLSPSSAGVAEITTAPTVVKLPMEFQFQLDNRENWLPYKFNSFQID
ncbi:2076_t:CDS:2 [Rhizophagus irregularis]|nr:2076_t:CDS:2 [Rhizophagus irregularis]